MLSKQQLAFLRHPVRCTKCGIVRARQTMGKDKWGWLYCIKGCDKRVLHSNEERHNGKVRVVKELQLSSFLRTE